MSFFNNKEDVLQIELTKYGKELIGNGNFNPVYYAFFDEDIIYDSNCFGIQEEQNATQKRILEETPYLKLQATYNNSFISGSKKSDKENHLLGLPLCTNDYSQVYAPAFKIQFLHGFISGSDFNSDLWYNKYGSYTIPQINLSPRTVKIIADSNYSKKTFEKNEFVQLPVKEDDTYVKVVLEQVAFDIFEENVEDLLKNFDIEILKIENDTVEKLNFNSNISSLRKGIIENDILVGTVPTFGVYNPDSVTDQNYLRIIANTSSITSYFNYSYDLFGAEGQISDRRLFIYDPELYIPPLCD